MGKTDLEILPRDLAERYRADDREVIASGAMKRVEEPFEDTDGHRSWIETIYPREQSPLYLTLNDQRDRRIDDDDFWREDGSGFPVEYVVTAARDEQGKTVGAVMMFHDITARKQAEARLLQLNRILRLLSDCNSALVHSPDEHTLIREVCEILTGHGGYRLAWVGFAEDPSESTLRPAVYTGPAAEYIAEVDWSAPEHAQSPAMRALRIGQPVALHDFASDPLFRPLLAQAERFGIASCIALPLKTEGRPFGVLALHASRARAFDAEEIVLLSELADDLAFGIVGLRTKAERDRAVEAREHSMRRAQKSLEDAIQAISYTVELRDAYTAGHQRQVADLAVAIAREIGLGAEQVRGIHLAGVVHDIGKIQVPVEILAKPTRLTEIEYEIIKTHAQAGYEILKDIEFPWPVADIVYQHHELLDGSGYPRGLKGDGILLDARIMAVADVVEAMASDRPYRPGLGIETALGEIERGAGRLYDPMLTATCVRLFRQQGYAFSD